MKSEKDIIKRSLEFQNNARDFSLTELYQYDAWVKSRKDSGIPLEILMELDSMCMWLLPNEVGSIGNDIFDELLYDLLNDLDEIEYINILDGIKE